MAGKRKRKGTAGTTGQREDLAKPSKWRLQHGAFGEPTQEADPQSGTPVAHRRAIDTLGALLANGSITAPMHDAGVIFRTQFRAAALNGMRVMPLLRVSGGKGATLTEYTIAARDKVSDVLGLFGGTDSACGSCLWHVLGLESSLREWATRQGWGGRSVNHVQAQGILVAALNVLAVHYGLAAGRRAA
jgi:hypothetical protein